MKRMMLVVVAVLVVALSLAAGEDESKVLQFQTMFGVVAPYTGAANPIRGVAGAGAPWAIQDVNGKLRSDGRLQIDIRGLVLVSTGLNPLATFGAIVSCQSIGAGSTATVVNVSAGPFPATTAGDAKIDADVELPTPCVAPIVFITTSTGRWIAASGR